MNIREERRAQPRIPADMVVRFTRNSIAPAMVKNLSLGGFFIETDGMFRVNDVVEFDVFLPRPDGAERRARIVGIVRRVQKDAPRGVGVEIRTLEADDRAELHALVDRVVVESRGPNQHGIPA